MSLVPRFVLGDLDLTDYPYSVQFGSDLGAPQNAAEVVESLLQDGEIVTSTRTSNRVITLSVVLEGADMADLAAAEAALIAECDQQRNELTIDPGDGYAAPFVFQTFRVQAAFDRDDDWEQALLRRYSLSIPALPWAMSEDEVVDVGLPANTTPATSTIADGTSATGWTAVDGTVTASSGVLHIPTHLDNTQFVSRYLLPSGQIGTRYRIDTFVASATKVLTAFNFATFPYISVEVQPGTPSAGTASAPFTVSANVDGVTAPLVATQPIGSNAVRFTFLSSDASASSLQIFAAIAVQQSPGSASLPTCEVRIDNVIASNTPPASSSTGRETLRSVTIQGSARTQGRLAVEHATASLGDVILYSRPSLDASSTPDMRRWRTSGGTTAAVSTSVSGFTETLATSSGAGTVFQVPATTLPRGAYLVYARVGSTSGTIDRTISASASTKVGATTVGLQTATSDSASLTTGSGSLQIVEVGEFVLPPADVPDGSSALVEFRLWASGSLVNFDEMWVFYVGEDSALTLVHAGDAGSPAVGTANNRLWLDTPTLERPEYSIWLGTQADRSDAYFAGQSADGWGVHGLPAGEALFFVANTGTATFPELSVAHRPHWWLHALDVVAS